MIQETIRSNAVGRLGDVRVGVGNIYERSADDPPRSGLSAQLFPGNAEAITVWTGDVVDIGGRRWTVAVAQPPGERGEVTLTPLDD